MTSPSNDNPHPDAFDPTQLDPAEWQETLSAYVDGELSDQQAEYVRARLATDEPSRKLVDDLSRVSDAVRSLPRASAPADLATGVLEAAQTRAASLSTDEGRARRGAGFTIGRSRRGWLFAGAAIAASLLLIVANRDAGRDELVVKSDAAAEDAPSPPPMLTDAGPRGELETAVELGVARSDVARGIDRDAAVGEFGGFDAARSPTDSPAEGPARGEPLDASRPAINDLAALSTSSDETRRRHGLALGEELATAADPVVVRVNLRPAAFRSRLVDDVLGANGIAVEATPASVRGPRAGGDDRGLSRDGLAEPESAERHLRFGRSTESLRRLADSEGDLARDGRGRGSVREPAAATPEAATRGGRAAGQGGEAADGADSDDFEIVVVVAPTSQVQGVLHDLNQDYLNCTSIAVEPAPAEEKDSTNRFYMYNSLDKQRLIADSLSQYSRSGRPAQWGENAPVQQQTVPGAQAPNPATRRAQANAGNAWAYKVPPSQGLAWEQSKRLDQLSQIANQTVIRAQQQQLGTAYLNQRRAAESPRPDSGASTGGEERQVPIVLIVQAADETAPAPEPAPE